MNRWSNKRMNDCTPWAELYAKEELAWLTQASSHWENTPGSQACQEAKKNRSATSCSSSNPRLSIHVMIFECLLGCGTIRLGILPINCWKPGQTGQQQLSHLTSRDLPQCNHQGACRHSQSKDTSNKLSGPGVPSLRGFQNAHLYSPFLPTIYKRCQHASELETVILKRGKKLKIMKNNWVQVTGNIRCFIQRLFLEKKWLRGFYIRNSCSTERISPFLLIPTLSSGGHAPAGTISSKAQDGGGEMWVCITSPSSSRCCLKVKYVWAPRGH